MLPQKLTFILLFSLLSFTLSAEQLTVVAKRGDGIYSILRHYGLLSSVQRQGILRINTLRRNAGLLVGRTYKLPIEKLTYNGKSIRSSTNNKNFNRALDIQHYNEALLEKGIREKDFRRDKILYVPFHIDNCPTPPQVESTTTVPSAANPTPQPEPDAEIKDIGEITKSDSPNSAPASAPKKPGGRPAGPAPEQQTTSAHRTFDIFGKEYAYVPKIDNKLAGRIFYIVSGHGGPDPGAYARRNATNCTKTSMPTTWPYA